MYTETAAQNQRILAYLQAGNTLTALQALPMFDCIRLPSRINELRKAGNPVITTMITVGQRKKKVAQYSLVQPAA